MVDELRREVVEHVGQPKAWRAAAPRSTPPAASRPVATIAKRSEAFTIREKLPICGGTDLNLYDTRVTPMQLVGGCPSPQGATRAQRSVGN